MRDRDEWCWRHRSRGKPSCWHPLLCLRRCLLWSGLPRCLDKLGATYWLHPSEGGWGVNTNSSSQIDQAGLNSSVEYVLSSTVVGNTGDLAQLRAGHVLAQGSFPSAAFANTSFFNLTSVSTVNDGNTTLAHNLTNNGTTLFDQVGIMGVDDQCPGLNGTTQYLSSSDAHFDPGDTDFTCGGWAYPTAALASIPSLFAQWNTAGAFRAFILFMTPSGFRLTASTDGTTNSESNFDYAVSLNIWVHVLLKYIASTNTFDLYVNGVYLASVTLVAGLKLAGTPIFSIGASSTGGNYFTGRLDEFFFCKGNIFSDDEISKIYAAKISHNRQLAPNQQDWSIDATYAGITRRIENDVIVDKDLNDLYLDCSGLTATTTIEAILQARGLRG